MRLELASALVAFIAAVAVAVLPDATPQLALPVDCKLGQSCEIQYYVDRDPELGGQDYRGGHVSFEGNTGVNIRVPSLAAQQRGVAVLAAEGGKVLRVRDGVPDVSVREAGRQEAVKNAECGNAVVIGHRGGWETQYCHLARGSVKVKPGDHVKPRQPIGAVGLSGNTEYPHLGFVTRKGSRTIDPFDLDGKSLWIQTPAYQNGSILNVGFVAEPLTMEKIETGDAPEPGPEAPILAAYGRAIDLHAGDIQAVVLKGPDGGVLASHRAEPLPRDQAQNMAFVGRVRPQPRWPRGAYEAEYQVWRDGKLFASRSARLNF